MNKTVNQKAWFCPSGRRPGGVQRRHPTDDRGELFGPGVVRREHVLLGQGVRWFEHVLHAERFHYALLRQISFTAIVLAIEIPLGLIIALAMPRKGSWVSVCLVLMALPLLIPWNVVGAMWNIMALPDIGLLGRTLNRIGLEYNYTRQPFAAWFTIVLMDVWHWTSLVVLLATPAWSRFPTPTTRPPRSTVPGDGPCSASSSCRSSNTC